MRHHPLLPPFAAGLGLRMVSAAYGYGWFAPDDLTYVIEQARIWFDNPEAPFPSDIRSLLLPRAFWLVLVGVRALGVTDPAHGLQVGYGLLGLWSLQGIVAAYGLAKPHFGERGAVRAAWLMAAFAIMPHISTRALIEVVAIPPLLWSLLLFDRMAAKSAGSGRFGVGVASGALLGFASMLRFQLGLLFPVLLGMALWRAVKQDQGPWQTRATGLAGLLLGGALAGLAQGLLDLSLGRGFLGTPLAYLLFNLQESSRYGASAWYTYLLQLVVFSAPPATLVLAKPLYRAARSHVSVSACLAVFVLAHSWIGHKEDRFLFPILPLFLVLLGAALAEAAAGARWSRLGSRFFWAASTVALVVATFSDAQRNRTVPLLAVARAGEPRRLAIVSIPGSMAYYAGPQADLMRVKDTDALARHIRATGWAPHHVLFRDAPLPSVLAQLESVGLRCGPARAHKGDLVDQALYALNRRRNLRRRPSYLMDCTASPPEEP